ncbi:hypothetical protein E2C01_053326 [Portunus trituberculatus]|uniref:Uncharacterized protein n=1 Tax=Portunus trituberculatus TaxID=210409 RepID=A0A5B7GGA6_PORTR|nr:hypothetical protein [Portunus trituberculatus]
MIKFFSIDRQCIPLIAQLVKAFLAPQVRSLPQAGTPVLLRLVEAAQTFLGLPKGGVRAVTIQAGGEGVDSSPVTHVWLVGPDAAVLYHTLLHRREEVRFATFSLSCSPRRRHQHCLSCL